MRSWNLEPVCGGDSPWRMGRPDMEGGWSPGGQRQTCGELEGEEYYLFCVVGNATLPSHGTRAATRGREQVGCQCERVECRRLISGDTCRKKVGVVLRASLGQMWGRWRLNYTIEVEVTWTRTRILCICTTWRKTLHSAIDQNVQFQSVSYTQQIRSVKHKSTEATPLSEDLSPFPAHPRSEGCGLSSPQALLHMLLYSY